MVALFVIATILVCLMVDYLVQKAERKREALVREVVLSPDSFILPRGYFFSKFHAWIELLFSGKIYIGVDDFIAKVLGRVDSIEVLPVGERVKSGDALFKIRQNGRELTFCSPISGEITAVNTEVLERPSEILEDPYLKGWIVMIEPDDIAVELKNLFVGSEASRWLRNELKRFREFISREAPRFSPTVEPTLADGGLIIKGVLEGFDNDVWEKFKREFIEIKN
jgi:glycine cleavage system H protein